MVIRKFNQKNYGVRNLIFISIAILLVVVVFFELISTINLKKDKASSKEYSGSNQVNIVGESLDLIGRTYSGEKSDYYDILFKSDKTYGLKSNKFNLNKFIGLDIEVEGTTMSFIKDITVINLDTIKLIDKNTVIKNNSYNFTKNLITFNFSKQNELKAELSEDDSIDISFDGQSVATIETFICNKINKSQDCETLGISYKYSNKDNFTSYGGYTFYRYDGRAWITFNDNLFGYIFKDIDDTTMLDLSSTIEIINREYVLTNKKNIVTNECQTNGENIIEIDDSKLEPRKENLLILTIKGSTNKKRKATCEIMFDLRNKWKPTKISLEFQETTKK